MPGVEKSDVKVVVENKSVDLSATHNEKKYHVKVQLKNTVDENSAKASYKNGILEIIFKLVEEEKPKGKTVEVE
jgi:HSP20 family protein